MDFKSIGNYQVRTDIYYDPSSHLWIDITSRDKAIIGVSPLFQETSGSFVALQMEKAGSLVSKQESFGMIEAEKHVGPLKAPLSGHILVANQQVIENPRLMNDDPYGQGWLMEMKLTHPDEITSLIHGETNVLQWFTEELKKFDEKGWIAQPQK